MSELCPPGSVASFSCPISLSRRTNVELLIVAWTPMGLSGVTTQHYPERRERTVEDERNEAYRGVDCETLGMTYPKNAESETGLEHVS
ncbi:hypothetical protein BO79DRAFT_230042 [Aspergillus costaricaensis CBS 115574]|uniref:Uncharacterized protein n=1 Tax=Aspergillus costaricaensis CBS 115574 TaxID=1448317 RepID=A0ACD1I984_9EURO|nr:hypothetical protein BO79DRAFT_230042 [Aspergillus costaricaensis CBS 115574]RAK86829.1 hypothetical protein BO79DRAFT_230042 [Aspergillus costaricaensis CBS 115574]